MEANKETNKLNKVKNLKKIDSAIGLNKYDRSLNDILKKKNKMKCPTFGCNGSGSKNLKSKTHRILKNCPKIIKNKILKTQNENTNINLNTFEVFY
jgi:hypothetical protein